MNRVYKKWIKTLVPSGIENTNLELTVQVEDIQWDQGDIGIWHKQQSSNSDSPSSRVTRNENCQGLPKLEHDRKELSDDEILSEWDSQYDFCVKDSPSNSPLRSKSQRSPKKFYFKHSPSNSHVRSKSLRSPKNKVKEAFVKGKDFVRSKVNSCRDIFSRNSMKETKRRSANETKEEECGGQLSGKDNSSSVDSKGHNSNHSNNDSNDNNDHRMTSDLKERLEMSTDNSLENNKTQSLEWSTQNGKRENTDYMVLPEVFTTYNGVHDKKEIQTDFNVKTNRKNNQEGEKDTDRQKNGESREKMEETTRTENQVEIVIVDEGTADRQIRNVQGVTEDQRDLEETFPLGSEAQSFENSARVETSQLEVPVDKRLKWLLGNLDQHSFGSDFSQNTATSNSSDISVDMLLQGRTDDPEEILKSLGFVNTEEADNPIERIPERFIVDKSGTADGVSISEVLSDNPELTQFLQAISDQQQEGTDNLDMQQANLDAMMAGQGNPNYGNMLTSVMHGMKFLNLLSSAKSLNNLVDKSEEHPSILQNPKNREYLAKQGFYERHRKSNQTDQSFKQSKLVKSQSLDASEKRKRFQATKSRNYSCLTNVPEQDEVFDSRKSSSTNYHSFGTSFGTARTSSFDNYHRSMTSMETSTDSYDSSDSPGGRHRSAKQEPFADSGIWNTEDSQKSIDEEYLTEFATDSARQRRSQVNRMMSSDSYNVGDDVDILSGTGSLESTLTANDFTKLGTKASTLKGSESFDDDVELYSEGYIIDRNSDDRAYIVHDSMDQVDSRRNNRSTERIQRENSNNVCLIQPENVPELKAASGWTKFQRRYGVEMSVKVPGNKIEADVVNNNYEISRNVEKVIPLETQTEKMEEKPGLGSIGKIESVQSDSSGFAEAEMPEPSVIQKVSSLGSSTESDQTFKSSITILPTKSNTSKMNITSPDGNQSISLDISGSEGFMDNNYSGSRIDVAVGTDDFSEYLHAPMISYHLHERDGEDSGTCSESDKSVILTIELPRNWINTNPNKKMGKPRVVSHLYKEIGPRSMSVELDKLSTNSDYGVYQTKKTSDYPLTRTASDGSVPRDQPQRSSTPYGYRQNNPKTSEPSSKQTLFSNQVHPRSSSPTSLSVFSDFTPMPNRTYSDMDHYNSESEYSLNLSTASLVSKTDSVSSWCNNSLEYYKLMKLVNQPVSFKTDSTGQRIVSRFSPKFNIKKWTQLKKQQQLEEETKLVQHTLQRYKAELNTMESHFLVKMQLVRDDLSYGDRDDVQELHLLWAEVRKEILLMEQMLTNRLGGINMGNDNYNPLLALDIVRKMTELLREQVYQQQVTNELEEEETAPSDTWWPGGSKVCPNSQKSASEVGSEHSFNNSLAELKETILFEVRQELHDNTQWLHRELQKKERELNALKLELMSSNIQSGTTRKKHFYESDV